jgi:hypothetical protein
MHDFVICLAMFPVPIYLHGLTVFVLSKGCIPIVLDITGSYIMGLYIFKTLMVLGEHVHFPVGLV